VQQATSQKRKRVSPALVAILILLVGAVGYFFYQQRVEEEAREQALAMQRAAEQAEVKRRADQREEVLRNPNGFLETSEITSFDKGIINDYRQLTGFTLLNKSPFPLKELKGTVEWVNNDGESAGSTPFSLHGSISAGDTKKFSTDSGTMKSGTLQTGASKLRLKFEHVAIVE
jgi:type II secretory pathway pseudopilin PulG